MTRHPAHECLVADLSADPLSPVLRLGLPTLSCDESVVFTDLGAPPALIGEIYPVLLTFPTMNVPGGGWSGD